MLGHGVIGRALFKLLLRKYHSQLMVILQKTLFDSKMISIYFGEGGLWRKKIIEERKTKEFKEKLHEKFVDCLNSEVDGDKAKELYKLSLDFLESEIVFDVNSVVQNSFT